MTDWDQLMPMHTRHEREVQLAYLDGYALALEEFLQATRTRIGMTMTEPEARGRRELRKVASTSLDGCRRALKRLKELTYTSEDVRGDLPLRRGEEGQADPSRQVQDQEL